MATKPTPAKTTAKTSPPPAKTSPPPAKTSAPKPPGQSISTSVKKPTPNEVAKYAPSGRVVTVVEDDDIIGDSQSPSGFENVGTSDMLIPRLTIIQSLSPQRQRNKPEFNLDAKEGMFCDTATGTLYEEELRVIPCYYAKYYLEWAPRSTGQGLVKNHGMDRSIMDMAHQDEDKKMVLDNGNVIAETATYFVLNLSAGAGRAFIPLSSTQLKSAKKWMNLLDAERVSDNQGRVFKPLMCFREWICTPVELSNVQGSWFGWNFTPGTPILDLDPSKELLRMAKDYTRACASDDNATLMEASVSAAAMAGSEDTTASEDGSM